VWQEGNVASKGHGELGCSRVAWHLLHCDNGQQPVLLHPFAFSCNFCQLFAIIVGICGMVGGGMLDGASKGCVGLGCNRVA